MKFIYKADQERIERSRRRWLTGKLRQVASAMDAQFMEGEVEEAEVKRVAALARSFQPHDAHYQTHPIREAL
jgi:hypothetical protein